MARISIETTPARNVLSKEDELQKKLKSLSQEASGVCSGLRYKISGQEQIAARLREAVAQLDKEARATGAMRSGLEQVITRYEQTEKGNLDRLTAEKTSVQQSCGGGGASIPAEEDGIHAATIWSVIWKNLTPVGFGVSPLSILPLLLVDQALPDASDNVEPIHKATVDVKKATGDDGIGKKVSDWEKAHQDDVGNGAHFYKNLKTGETTKVNADDEDAMKQLKSDTKGTIPVDVRLAGVGTSGSVAVVDTDWGGRVGLLGHEGNVSVLKFEGDADAYLGLGLVGAGVGASITAFSAEEKGYLGTEDTQVYGKVGVTVGKADAQADVSVGVVDKNGNFNPSMYAGASAEILGGELSGTVGVKAVGVDVGLKGSVNYGLGAHANVGLHDGKLSVDIGATLGVGASVKVDIDFSEAIDAVSEKAGDIWSGIKSIF
jgi:hypothetical protein